MYGFMDKKYLSFILLILIIIVLSFNAITAQAYTYTIFPNTTGQSFSYILFPNSTFTDLNEKIPSYEMILVPDQITTNPGETIKVDIFISGLGYIQNNKIHVFTPENLLNPENPGLISVNIACVTNNTTNITQAGFIEWTAPLLDPKFSIAPCNFMSIDSNLDPNVKLYRAPPIMSEERYEGQHQGYKGKPPIYLMMNIADNATPGDRGVNLVFTYTDGIKWYQDKEKITIHVNNPLEENRQILLIILAILAFSFSWVSEYTKELYKEILSSRYRKVLQILTILAIISLVYLVYVSIIK